MIAFAAALLLATTPVGTEADQATRIATLYDEVCVEPLMRRTSVAEAATAAGLSAAGGSQDRETARVQQLLGAGSWTIAGVSGKPVLSSLRLGRSDACYLAYTGPIATLIARANEARIVARLDLQPGGADDSARRYGDQSKGPILQITTPGPSDFLQVGFVN